MVNGDDSTRVFVVYRDSNSEPLHARAHKTRMSSMTLTSMSARSSAMSTTASASSPHKHAHDRSRLRKLVSLSYYSGKVKSWFHREDRDTIVCEDDEEAGACDGPTSAAAVTVPPSVLNNPTSVASAFYASWMEANAAAAAASAATVTPCTPLGHAASSEHEHEHEPSKEQRWCTNCAKCFQRSLSRYDQFCGLDCRTAHRFRLAA